MLSIWSFRGSFKLLRFNNYFFHLLKKGKMLSHIHLYIISNVIGNFSLSSLLRGLRHQLFLTDPLKNVKGRMKNRYQLHRSCKTSSGNSCQLRHWHLILDFWQTVALTGQMISINQGSPCGELVGSIQREELHKAGTDTQRN